MVGAGVCSEVRPDGLGDPQRTAAQGVSTGSSGVRPTAVKNVQLFKQRQTTDTASSSPRTNTPG